VRRGSNKSSTLGLFVGVTEPERDEALADGGPNNTQALRSSRLYGQKKDQCSR